MNPADTRRLELTTSLASAGRHWARLVEHSLGDSGIPTGCITPLIFIGRATGGINQVTLADRLGLAGPSLVRLLDWLCEARLMRRDKDSTDRRAKQLFLTKAGRRLADKFESRLIEIRAEVLGSASMDDVAAVLRVHALIAAAALSCGNGATVRRRRI